MVKKADIKDINIITDFAVRLWGSHSYDNIKSDFSENLKDCKSLYVLGYIDGNPCGFAECKLRFDYVEGTSSSPVGYLEGIYVDINYRRQGLAKEMIEYCKSWAKENKCKEFASDCALDNTESLEFHLRAGFTEVNRIICFKQNI